MSSCIETMRDKPGTLNHPLLKWKYSRYVSGNQRSKILNWWECVMNPFAFAVQLMNSQPTHPQHDGELPFDVLPSPYLFNFLLHTHTHTHTHTYFLIYVLGVHLLRNHFNNLSCFYYISVSLAFLLNSLPGPHQSRMGPSTYRMLIRQTRDMYCCNQNVVLKMGVVRKPEKWDSWRSNKVM